MFDPLTAELIQRMPPLEGIESATLPDRLSGFYAKIATARLRLRASESVHDQELAELLAFTRRLAFTNEALVSVSPYREDRAAAAFVAATAHQLVFNAERIGATEPPRTFLNARSISPDIAAMLLFLVAEASADALEMAVRVEVKTEDSVERAVIVALSALARGDLGTVQDSVLPPNSEIRQPSATDTAASALYRTLLKGVHALAFQLLHSGKSGEPASGPDPLEIFLKVKSLCTARDESDADGLKHNLVSVFSGPSHLAAILIAVAHDMSRNALVALSPPGGVDPDRWQAYVERVARSRPVLWRNHREAINRGYLEPGVSSAVGFPTGAGKSALAELKIATALLTDRKVIFLAPTHALVDQTSSSLARSFPTANIEQDYSDETGLPFVQDMSPDVLVMTPEACLTQMSFDCSMLEEAGLLVFDECHLLHPNKVAGDRRALDAMLCVLNFARLAPDADFLLLSAMMKNTDEIARWIGDLTTRRCLALTLSWKPTRQLRGSVVYQKQEITGLSARLRRLRQTVTTATVPATAKRNVQAQPFGLFSLKQTWATKAQDDYAFSPLLEERPVLGISPSWQLIPNSGEVSSAIAEAAAKSGIKTLIFFQTIRNANSAARKISVRLGSKHIALTAAERSLFRAARRELGGTTHLYLDVRNGHVEAPAAVHHGLLLREERRLVEALYRRAGGVAVLTATSTVAQGMNLPSELVIIAEDSRFDRDTERREILKAQELLNAAGRAGRAGHSPNGIVLVVPGKIVTYDYDDAKIGLYWSELHAIFGQSDQCLEIDDPLTAVLDRVHANRVDPGVLEKYCVAKLAGRGAIDESDERLSWAVRRSLVGYKARQQGNHAWLDSRTEAATQLLAHQDTDTEDQVSLLGIAATIGLPLSVVSSLAEHLASAPLAMQTSVTKWRRWFFKWLAADPSLLDQILRRDDLDTLFGMHFKRMDLSTQRSDFAVPRLGKLTRRWMNGRPLRDLEVALGVDPTKLKTCDGARKFVIRIVPSLAYACSLPAILKQHSTTADRSDVGLLPPQLAQFSVCVRHGFDTHEKAALHHLLRAERLSRIVIHERFNVIRPHLAAAVANETWEGTLSRVETALSRA